MEKREHEKEIKLLKGKGSWSLKYGGYDENVLKLHCDDGYTTLHVVGRLMLLLPPLDVHLLISRKCKYIKWQDETQVVSKLTTKQRDNHREPSAKVLTWGRGKQKSKTEEYGMMGRTLLVIVGLEHGRRNGTLC
jgi:hypothetical protein